MPGGEEELLSDDVRATDWGERFPGQYETEHREEFLAAQGLDPDDPNVPSELGPDPVTGMDPQQFGQFVHRYKRELVPEWPDDLDDNPANLRMDRPGGGRPLEADGVRFGADPENPDKHQIYELKPNTNPHAHERQEVLYPHYKQEQHGGTFDFEVVPYDPQELRHDMSDGRWPERPAAPTRPRPTARRRSDRPALRHAMAPDTQLTAEQFHAASLSLIDQLTDRCAAYDLSEAPQALLTLRRKLADDDRRVIVVGPAKRGKTTFVNALIGADVLPTGVNVTTNQPFYVRPAETEGYRLRFEDGSATEIGADDLELYGSEVAAEEGRAPELEAPLRWIEVDVPARFVPDGLAIVDLPGTDALYAAHAEITRRFVPLADAVIFVMDSDQPFGRQEQKLLESLLEVTTRIFFVQTKIDQHGRQAWEQTRARNEQILEEEFGERLSDRRVWPVSSTNLMAVAASDGAEDALLMVSRYRELADALREFLADVCSAPRAVAALILATRHHQATRQVLEDRLQSLTPCRRLTPRPTAARSRHGAPSSRTRGEIEAPSARRWRAASGASRPSASKNCVSRSSPTGRSRSPWSGASIRSRRSTRRTVSARRWPPTSSPPASTGGDRICEFRTASTPSCSSRCWWPART